MCNKVKAEGGVRVGHRSPSQMQPIDADASETTPSVASTLSPGDVPSTDASPLELSDDTFDSAVINNGLMMIDFWAPWCSPCRAIAPVLEEVVKERAGKLVLAKLNVRREPCDSLPLRRPGDTDRLHNQEGRDPRPHRGGCAEGRNRPADSTLPLSPSPDPLRVVVKDPPGEGLLDIVNVEQVSKHNPLP